MDVAGRLRLAVIRKGLDAEILVNNCGTIDLCDCGPNIVVYPDNVIYNGVTVKDIPEIMTHLEGGPVVERLVLSATSDAELVRKGFYAEAMALEGGLLPGRRRPGRQSWPGRPVDRRATAPGFHGPQTRCGNGRRPHPGHEKGSRSVLAVSRQSLAYTLAANDISSHKTGVSPNLGRSSPT